MATIADQKSALEKWAPLVIFDVVLKDGTPRYWAKQAVTFGGHSYIAIVLEHSEMRLEGNGVYGVDAVAQIGLTLNNADANLNALITPANWQGGVIQPRFIFVSPDGTTTTDAIVYPKFLMDLPTATWPRIEFSAHNKWNLARKMVPLSLVTKKDRYPFPDTAAERTAAGSDPSSEFFASGYDPDTGKGNMNGGSYYRRHEYDGTREMLRDIGLEVRYGGFGRVPPTVVGTPSKGQTANYVGNANEAKYGQAVPLVFGICRIQPIVLETGFPTAWKTSRLSHYLLSDGVTFGPEASMGIEAVLDVFIPDSAKFQRIPQTSGEPSVTGAWNLQGGYYGSQKAPASSKYRNIDQATDFPVPAAEFPARDLYSGLAYLEVGFPKELSGEDGVGPKLEAIVKGLKLETWDSGGTSSWEWTDNPVWIFVHLLKLLRWSTADMDKPAIAAAAAYCDEVIGSGKPRFRCNLALMNQTKANDVLRGVRNNCRMYTSFAADGKLQLRIAQNVAGEGGLAFTLDNTTIMRGDDGQLLVEKFHRSVFETANVFTSVFQNEENLYNSDSVTMTDVRNVNQIDERVPADSIFPMLGIPSFDQAERQLEWARQEQVTLNEYYRVTASFALIEAKVGQVGTITEPRHGLIAQQVRIRAMAPGPDAGTVELVLQKHSDGAYTDQSVETPFTRAQADSSYTPRSVGGKFAASPAPVLTEVIVAGPDGIAIRRIKVEFKPPSQTFEGVFSRETKISDVVVATSGGSVPGGQVLFVEVAPIKAGVRGLASEYLMAVIPSGGNTNTISLTCELPPEADQYILFVGNFPGQTYEQTVAASPGTAAFTITVVNLNRNFGSIPPDPAFDHVSVFYRYNSSPNVLRDGGRTFSPTETTLEFEPEAPAGNDTQVTVYVSSTNAAEDDFYPIEISPKATLTLTQETGKPMDWEAILMPGPTPSSVIPKFTRPKINGKRLFWVSGQIKDTSIGVWRELDEHAGASVVYYDGSAISHESVAGKIKKDPGQPLGFGSASIDDMIMLDVAGGSFDRDRCQWGTVQEFQDDLGAQCIGGVARYVVVNGLFRPQTTQDLRMKIVRPHHVWDTEGYLGNASGTPFNGIFWEWVGDREGDEFILAPVEIGRDLESVDVRFWIENDYCRSGGGKIVSDDHIRVKSVRDNVLPGQVENLLVVAHGPEFIATWNDPLTGKATLDDATVQYADDAGFTTGVITAGGLGHVNRATGLDPGKTYYFRVAVRNQSGLDNHADTTILGTLGWGTTGWGPWKAFGAPTSVTSSASTGPTDSVIPGPVQSLVVAGGEGKFVADWVDPATGNLTLDDHAIEWATNPGFTIGVQRAKGWGDVNHLASTDPGKTYYFRVAAHNQSGAASDSSTSATLGATGWGPWTAYGSPSAVSSGGIAGLPSDSVIPGQAVNFIVTGGDGKFIATWDDPTTGNQTMDDIAIQWATDAAFTVNVQTAPGWGYVNRLESTEPNSIYWFRLAVHNQSNQPSAAATAFLGATGWGPWVGYGASVASGTAAGAGWQSPGENLCPNPSFELDADNDGLPDDTSYPFNSATAAGSARASGGVHGTYCFNIKPGNSAVGLGGFGVIAGEKLSISAWAFSIPVVATAGFYIRVCFHATDRQFAVPAATVDVAAAVALAASWVKYEGQVTVPAGMHWCRIQLWNAGTSADYYVDNVVVTRTTLPNDLGDNTIPPVKLTGEARTDYVETFETALGDYWQLAGAGTLTRVFGAGIDGGYALQTDGSKSLWPLQPIPYDRTKLYRMTMRARVISLPGPTNGLLFCGVRCLDINKADLGVVRVCYNNFQMSGAWTANFWYEVAGFFKGEGGTAFTGPAPDSQNPFGLITGTRYIVPDLNLLNPGASPGTGHVMQVDDIRIESFDEATYTSPAPNGTFGTLSKLVTYPWGGESSAAAVSLFWDYTDGLVKAQQFAIYVNDTVASWVQRVRARAGTGALRHLFTIYRLAKDRPIFIRVTAEAIRPGGQIPGPSDDWGTFTPNVSSGSDPGGSESVGEIDWAGGNIWFDSYQYRNNIGPSNGTTSGITIAFPEAGSGIAHAVISGLNTSYTQGTYIATHLAVIVKAVIGTIDLNRDCVIARISMASLPATFTVPLGLADNGSFTLAVVAVAMVKSGAVPNGTWTPRDKAVSKIFISAFNSPRTIDIGDSGFAGETVNHYGTTQNFYHDLRLISPVKAAVYSSGGAYQGGFSGDASGLYMANAAGRWFEVTQHATYPNFIFNNMTDNNQWYGCLLIADGGWAANNPVGGGLLYANGGAGHWKGPSGSDVIFGPAGPHCAKCGYDFWLVAVENPEWKASLHICGWCGARYAKGPKKILDLLTKQERSEIIRDSTQASRPPRLRRRGVERKRRAGQNRRRRA